MQNKQFFLSRNFLQVYMTCSSGHQNCFCLPLYTWQVCFTQISKGQKHEQLLRNWVEKQVVRIQKFYHQNLLQPDPRPHLRAPATSGVVSYMTSSAFCLTIPFLLSVYLTVLFLAGPLVWQLPLRRQCIHICIWTAVIHISNATLHLHAHRI